MNDQPKPDTTSGADATSAPDGPAAPRTPNGTPSASQALTAPTEARDGASPADTSPATELRTAADVLAPETDTPPTLTGDYPNPDACYAHLLRTTAETCDAVTLDRPVPAKGRLGIWTPDAELLAAVTVTEQAEGQR